MLFGTSKKLSSCGKNLSLMFDDTEIQATETYKYLGTTLDSSLSLSTNFDKIYKRSVSKLRMLSSLQSYLDDSSKRKVYNGMILPCITYNCTVNLNLSQTQRNKLKSIDNLAETVTGTSQPPVENVLKKQSILLVRKCLERKTCTNFIDYFKVQSHGGGTRNDGYKLQIPFTKLKYAKSGFFSMGVTLYNELPLNICKIENFNLFRKTVLKIFNL